MAEMATRQEAWRWLQTMVDEYEWDRHIQCATDEETDIEVATYIDMAYENDIEVPTEIQMWATEVWNAQNGHDDEDDGLEGPIFGVMTYDRAQIRKAWEAYTEGVEDQYPWTEDIVDEVVGLVEESRWEMDKGRTTEMLSIEDAVEIVCDAQ